MGPDLPVLTGRTDDRGTPIRVLAPAGAADWPMAGDARVALLAARMHAVSTPPRWMHLSLIAIIILLTGSSMFLVRALFPTFPRWSHIAPAVAIGLSSSFLMAWLRRRWAGPALARLLIEEGLCPGCGYNLFGLITADTSLLACPECGSAWQAERVKRAESFAAGAKLADANTVLAISSASSIGRDDHGERCPFVHPRLRTHLKSAANDATRSRLREARREIARSGRVVRWSTAFLLIGVGCAFGLAISLYGAPSTVAFRNLLVPVGVFFVLALLVLFGNFGYSKRRIRLAMLRRQLCPSCATPLAAVRPTVAEAAPIVCPACRAAWHSTPE